MKSTKPSLRSRDPRHDPQAVVAYIVEGCLKLRLVSGNQLTLYAEARELDDFFWGFHLNFVVLEIVLEIVFMFLMFVKIVSHLTFVFAEVRH